MKTLNISVISLALLLLASITAQAAQAAQAAQLASAKVIEVVGTAYKFTPDGKNAQLKVGDLLKEGDSLSVTALSIAKLVFSNGSELTIEENSSVSIAELQQESFTGSQSYEQLKADPSKSQTLLELNYGKLSGHVKKLRSDSSFKIETPLGTAAIRGTQWSVNIIYNAERQEFLLTVKNFDGLVDIISRYIGEFAYGSGSIGDKGYNSGVTVDVTEPIPINHIIVIRLGKDDPYFDVLFNLMQNFIPTGPTPVITPGPYPGDDDDDDFGIIVVSPEGPNP